jgi:hypothetical protein
MALSSVHAAAGPQVSVKTKDFSHSYLRSQRTVLTFYMLLIIKISGHLLAVKIKNKK